MTAADAADTTIRAEERVMSDGPPIPGVVKTLRRGDDFDLAFIIQLSPLRADEIANLGNFSSQHFRSLPC